MDDEKIIQEIRDIIQEAKAVKNGDWKTQRALFEQKTTDELIAIRKIVESYSNIIQSSAWFFTFTNFMKKNKKWYLVSILILLREFGTTPPEIYRDMTGNTFAVGVDSSQRFQQMIESTNTDLFIWGYMVETEEIDLPKLVFFGVV